MVWPASSWWLSVQSVFSSRVSLFPFVWGQFSELWQLMSRLQSGHHVSIVLPPGGVSVSTRQLKGYEDMAQNVLYRPWGGTKDPWLCLMTKLLLFCPVWLFSFASEFFFTSLITLILWLKFFYRQKTGGGHGRGGRTTGSCSISVTEKSWPSMNLEMTSHQTPNLLVPRTSQPPEM